MLVSRMILKVYGLAGKTHRQVPLPLQEWTTVSGSPAAESLFRETLEGGLGEVL